MNIEIECGQVVRTDYFDSADCRRGQAWCVHLHCVWHLLTSSLREEAGNAFAVAVQDDGEEEGWSWELRLGGQRLVIPQRCWVPIRPLPPDPGQHLRRRLLVYSGFRDPKAGSGHFGALHLGMRVAFSKQLVVSRRG